MLPVERMQADVAKQIREVVSSPALPPPPPPAPSVPRKPGIYPKTCAEYAIMGDRREGFKTIQPYRDMKPFTVKCTYNGDLAYTEVSK